MGMPNLNQLVPLQRQRQRRGGSRQIQARGGGSTSSRLKRKRSLDGQIKGYSGPDLPEDIWCHIHSLMPLQDAAQAACVSRSFLGSWRRYPNLVFSEKTLGLNENARKNDRKSRDFASTVYHVLINHSGIGVKTFKLDVFSFYNSHEIYDADLEIWLQIAIKLGIEELYLSLPRGIEKYNFPCSLLSDGTGDSLRYLHLGSCNFHPTLRLGCLRSLTRLDLCTVCIAEDELECLLSGCFALERFDLKLCDGIICLKIPCLQQLSHLEVLTCTGLRAVEIKAPNLSSFRFAGDLNVQLSLLEASRIKKYERYCSGGIVFYARTELPSSMPNLDTLTLHSDAETVNTPVVPSKFLHLKFLAILLGGQAYDVLSLVSFLNASPSLEAFSLNVRSEGMEHISLLEEPSNLRKMSGHRHKKLKPSSVCT